jgi:hypothetical protein
VNVILAILKMQYEISSTWAVYVCFLWFIVILKLIIILDRNKHIAHKMFLLCSKLFASRNISIIKGYFGFHTTQGAWCFSQKSPCSNVTWNWMPGQSLSYSEALWMLIETANIRWLSDPIC